MHSGAPGRSTGSGRPGNAPHDGHWSSWIATALTAAVVGAAYFLSLPGHVQAGDAGEFSTVLLRGGMPHPSGYPWMRVLGLLAPPLEAAGLPPATAAALPCALAGVVGWTVLQRTATSWGAPWIGAWAACFAALGTTPMLHVPDAEVWGLLILWSAVFVRVATGPHGRPAFVLGLVLGLATSHHLTAVLLTPLAVGAAWPQEPGVRRLLRAGMDGLAGVALGLGAFLLLLVGDGGAWRWGDVDGLPGLWQHMTRADYGTFALSLQEVSPPATLLIERSLTGVAANLTVGLAGSIWLAAPVLAVVLVSAWRSPPPGLPRPAWHGLLASALTCLVLFPAAHNLDPRSPFSAWILERFDILTILLVATATVGALVAARDHLPTRLSWIAAPVGVALLALQLQRSIAHGTPASDDAVERYALDLLDNPAPGTALVFGTNDHRLFPVVYAQSVLEVGEQVVYVDAYLLSRPWYRQRLRAQWGPFPEIDKPVRLISYLWQDRARRDLPIYLANVFSKPAAEQLRLVPEGVLWRVVPPHAPEEAFDLDAVLDRHRAAMKRLRGTVPSAQPGHPWAGDVAAAYLDTTRALAEALSRADRTEEADALMAELRAKLEGIESN